jgi:hypothetical protein
MVQAVSRLGLPPWKPGFDPRQVHMRFVVTKMALRQVFTKSASVFTRQCYSTIDPYSFSHQSRNCIIVALDNIVKWHILKKLSL